MHEVAIPQPFFRLPLHLTLFAILVAFGCKRRSEVVNQILSDEARLGKHEGLGSAFSLNADNWGFAERVDFLELRRCHHISALVRFQLILDLELLKQPQSTLCSRLFEPRA